MTWAVVWHELGMHEAQDSMLITENKRSNHVLISSPQKNKFPRARELGATSPGPHSQCRAWHSLPIDDEFQ